MTRADRLEEIALRGLVRCYNPETRLFRAKLVETPDGIEPVGLSFRYSGMAAIGLCAAARRGLSDPALPLDRILSRLAETALAGCDELDLALVLWAHAVADTGEVPALFAEVERTYRRHVGWYTCMGLSWSLAAVEHVVRLGSEVSARAASLAEAMAADLGHYQHPRTALFAIRHRRVSRKLLDTLVEARVGTFANHSYASYALSLYAARTRDERAAACVRRCVEAVCGGQGERGQWWWMVDTRTGRWVDRYPVYAVHQDAMAPFCLYAARAFTKMEVAAHLRRGLDWLFGENELGESLVDVDRDIIWRAIQRADSLSDGEYGVPENTLRRRRAVGLGLGFLANRWPLTERLVMLRESRSYHLGWVLFAREALLAAESREPTPALRSGR